MVAFRVQPHARTRATRARRSHPCASALRAWAQPRGKESSARRPDRRYAARSCIEAAGERSRRPVVPPQARLLVALALCGTAAAYVAPQAPKSASALNSKAELEALAEANGDFLGSTLGFWDPLGVTNLDFWGLGEEGTIGYLRHAEIKHGRVAMAGFLGFCAQSTPLVAGEHSLPYRYRGESLTYPTPPYRGFVENVSPQEQWDNIPLIGKLQILVFVGMLESYGEGAGQPDGYVHYTKGGLPGYFPPIEGRIGPFPIGNLNLYKPFDIFPEQSEDEKARGRQVEINNGRLAMLGLISLLTESNGLIVPPLDGIEGFPKYAGNVMIPFSADFSLY
jgi:hypothetical protein